MPVGDQGVCLLCAFKCIIGSAMGCKLPSIVTPTVKSAQSSWELAALVPSITSNSLHHSPLRLKSTHSPHYALSWTRLLPLILPPRLRGSLLTIK